MFHSPVDVEFPQILIAFIIILFLLVGSAKLSDNWSQQHVIRMALYLFRLILVISWWIRHTTLLNFVLHFLPIEIGNVPCEEGTQKRLKYLIRNVL